ncbi:MAG: TrkH family potassium uptake protein [Candidatus Hodarchaeaceae archaeon]|nr:TrkH family potassium uptake protein [Candidatus Hodarchaeaceae archaeon]
MLHFLGFILLVIGGVMLVPAVAAFVLGEPHLAINFAAPAIGVIALAILMRRFSKPTEPSLGKLMVVVTLGWILAALFSTVPYMLSTNMGFVDSYFESMSGFTTTGLTMIQNPEAMARTVLFWRSLTQWVGGIGIVVLVLTALVGAGKAAKKMYIAEARIDRIEPSIKDTTRSILKIYLIFTILGVVAFMLIGMPLFDSINHTLAGISTGGFSTRSQSLAAFGDLPLIIGIILTMAGATSFVIHRKVLAGHWRELFSSVEFRFMIGIFVVATLLLVWSVGIRDAAFQSAEAITTTGFQSANIYAWGGLQKGLLCALMIIGAGFGSTGGGIKLIRVLIILKSIWWSIKRSFLPERAIVPIKVGGRTYAHEDVTDTAIFFFIYIITLVVGAALIATMLPPGYGGADAFFESTSAQSNVGLSVGLTPILPDPGKIVLIVQMLIGRLEIIPVIAFLSYLVSKVPRPRRKPV